VTEPFDSLATSDRIAIECICCAEAREFWFDGERPSSEGVIKETYRLLRCADCAVWSILVVQWRATSRPEAMLIEPSSDGDAAGTHDVARIELIERGDSEYFITCSNTPSRASDRPDSDS
jgi:hypothetical protein